MSRVLLSLNLARADEPTIKREPVTGPRAVALPGIEGDHHPDPSLHGIGKAVHAYPVEHYAFWQTVRAQARVAPWDAVLPPGSMGENLTLSGLSEMQAWVGDVLRFPDCELAVHEPHYPSARLDEAMGFRQAAKLMWSNGWCGFYLAVRKPGTIEAGQSFELIPGPREIGIPELFRAQAEKLRSEA